MGIIVFYVNILKWPVFLVSIFKEIDVTVLGKLSKSLASKFVVNPLLFLFWRIIAKAVWKNFGTRSKKLLFIVIILNLEVFADEELIYLDYHGINTYIFNNQILSTKIFYERNTFVLNQWVINSLIVQILNFFCY